MPTPPAVADVATAMRTTLLTVLRDEYGGTPEDWTGMGSLRRVSRAALMAPADDAAEMADVLLPVLLDEYGFDAEEWTAIGSLRRVATAALAARRSG